MFILKIKGDVSRLIYKLICILVMSHTAFVYVSNATVTSIKLIVSLPLLTGRTEIHGEQLPDQRRQR